LEGEVHTPELAPGFFMNISKEKVKEGRAKKDLSAKTY
jgi:hypothetical protein